MNNEPVFSTRLTLPYSAINSNGQVKADWLLNVFQDAATQQCHSLGISGFDMAKKQLKWVVAQYRINIQEPIGSMMPLVLRTWRAPWKNLYEIREFTLGQEHGPPMVTATSVWILIKAATGKPVRLTPHMPSHMMEDVAQTPPDIIRPGEFGDFHHETIFTVRFLDLDLNQHVNNRIYLRWAIDSLPEPYCFEYSPARCQVVYRKEGLWGDRVASRVRLDFSGDQLSTAVSILRLTSKEELARLDIAWRKISPIHVFSPPKKISLI